MKKIVVLGSGESGTGAAVLASKQKEISSVFVSDSGKIKDKYISILKQYNIGFEENSHNEQIILQADEVIKSPGISEKSEIISKIKSNNIPIISEIEFAGRYTNAKKICISGSNGKTTTTMLTFEILKKAGFKVALGGNVGKSFAMLVAEDEKCEIEYFVLEISSFQLDDMYDFKADIAILLNITPDHLDRYNYKFENYIHSKFRIIQNQKEGDIFIYCNDDEAIVNHLNKIQIHSQKFPFSIFQKNESGSYLDNNNLIFNINNNQFTMSMFDLALQGKHNIYNSMAASIAASVLEIRKETIRECLSSFQGVEHRLEPVLRVHGIQFINDSKATNINSTWYALESMKTPIIWIVGGIDKGNDYSMLSELVKEKVKAIVCLGIDNEKIHQVFESIVPTIVDTTSMKDAVRSSYYLANDGYTVLLSPCCASFDLFENYEDRGRQFKEFVREL